MADRKSRVQSEIENFLAEVTGAAPPKRKQQDVNQQEQRRRQEAAAKRKQREAAAARRRKAAAAALAKSKQKKRQTSGSSISQHVDEYIGQHVAEHIDNDVEEYVEATIVDSVDSHLGKRDAEMPKPTGGPSPSTSGGNSAAAEVAKLLRDPKGVRNAILISEILSRPRALRRD